MVKRLRVEGIGRRTPDDSNNLKAFKKIHSQYSRA